MNLSEIKAVFLASSLGLLHVAHGATWISDTDGNWDVNANWSPATFPNGPADTATFSSVLTATAPITVGSTIPIQISSLTVSNAFPDFTISLSGNTLTLSTINNSSSANNDVTAPINYTAGLSSTITAGSLTISGNISGTGLFAKGNAGTLVLGGSNSFVGNIENTGTGKLSISSDGNLGNASNSINNVATLQVTTNSFSTSRALTNAGTLEIVGVTTTWDGLISAGALTKTGSGTLILTNASNSYTGTTINLGTLSISSNDNLGNVAGGVTINGGTLQTTASFSSARDISLGASNGTIETVGVTTTLTGAISGAGALIKEGSGTLVLQNVGNSYLGNTEINNGILSISDPGNLGDAGNELVLSGATLQTTTNSFAIGQPITLDTSGTFDVVGVTTELSDIVSGTGADLTKTGIGTLALAEVNSYTGVTTISQGTVALTGIGSVLDSSTITGAGVFDISGITDPGTTVNNLAVSGSVVLGAKELTFGTSTTSTTCAAVISGVGGSIVKQGSGRAIFTGVSTYDFGTTINAGRLQFSGAGALDPAGSVNLTGATSVFDISPISASTFTIGDLSGASGSTVALGDKELVFGTATPTVTFSGIISGVGGSIVKEGSGTVVLTGASTFTGLTTLNDGTVSISSGNSLGASGGAIVFDGGTLRTTANLAIGRALILTSDGTIDTASTTFLNGVVSGAGALIKMGSARLNLVNTSNSYLGGTQILDGILAISSDSNLGSSGTGILVNNGELQTVVNSFTIPRPISIANGAVIDIEVGTVTVTGQITGAGGLTKTGEGILALTNLTNNYTDGTTISQGAISITADVLGDAAGVLTLDGGTLQTTTNNFSITRDVVIGLGGGTFNTTSVTTQLDGIISGVGGALTKTGTGTLVLTAANTYDSGTTITMGTLALSGGGAIDSAGSVSGGGTFDISGVSGAGVQIGDLLMTGLVNLGSKNLEFGTATPSATFGGVINGTGSVTKDGTGIVIFSGPSNYTGGTFITGGTLQLSGAGSLAPTGSVGLTSATSIFNISLITSNTTIGDLTGVAGSSVILGSKTLTIGTATPLVQFAGVVSGAGGSLIKQGSGTFEFFEADQTYDGGTTINDGTLRLTKGASLATTGSVNINGASAVFNIVGIDAPSLTIGDLSGVSGGSVVLDVKNLVFGTATPSTTFAGAIGGTGGVTKNGTGTAIWTGPNSYGGGTTVSAGVLQGNTTSLQGAILNNAALIFEQASTGTYAGAISGSGTVTKQAAGILTFTGINSYTGGTTISAGTLALSGAGTLAATGAVNLTGSSAVFDISGIAAPGLTIGDLEGVAGSTVILGDTALTFGTITPTTTFAGVIQGTGSISKVGGGTAILTGANTYSGGTSVGSGALQGDTISLQGDIADNATLVFDQSFDGTYAGSINDFLMFSGDDPGAPIPGNLVKQGSGSVTLTGSNSLTGSVTVSGGSLIVNGTLAGAGTMTTSAGTLVGGTGTITQDITFGGTLAPGNSIGTINLVGVQTLATGSALEVEFDPTTSDLVNVTGTMTIDPGVTAQLIPFPGSYASSTTYTIIATTGGVSGTFSAVTSTLPLLTGTLTYTPLSVLLQIDFLPFTSLPLTGNASQVAHCLDNLSATAGGDLAFVIGSLRTAASAQQLNAALLQIEPSQFTGLALTQENNTLNVNRGVFNHIDALMPLCGLEQSGVNLWVAPFAAHETQSGHHTTRGYRATTPGVLVGADKFITSQLLVGGAIGYTYTDFDWMHHAGSAHVQTGYASFYGKWGRKYIYMESALMLGYSGYDTRRNISLDAVAPIHRTAKGSHNGLQGSVHLKLAGDYTKEVTFTPFVQVDYLYLHEDSFIEHGAQSLDLDVQSKSSDLLVTEAGLKLSYCFNVSHATLTPFIQGSAFYEARYRGRHEKARLVDCLLNVTGLNPSRWLGTAQAGLNTTLKDQTYVLSLYYQGRYGHHFLDNAGYFQASIKF